MKKIMTALVLSSLAFSSFAGSLYNLSSGEVIEFSLDKKSRTLEILSTAAAVTSRTVVLRSVSAFKDDVKL